MKYKNLPRGFIFQLAIAVAITIVFMKLTLNYIDLGTNSVYLIQIMLLSTVCILSWLLIFKKPITLLILLIPSVLTVGCIAYFHSPTYNNMIDSLTGFLSWLMEFIKGESSMEDSYFKTFINIIIGLESLIVVLLIYKIKNIMPLLISGTLILMYSWFNHIDQAIYYFGFFMTFVLILYAFRNYEEMNRKWKVTNEVISKNFFNKWILYSIGACALVVIFSLALPKNFDPLTWNRVDNFVQRNFPQVYEWRSSKEVSSGNGQDLRFDLTLTPYQHSDRRLGGPINTRDILVMKVDANEPLYLKGRVSDFYSGYNWRATQNPTEVQSSRSDNSFYKNEKIEGIEITQKITHINITTSTMFNSYIPKRIAGIDGQYYSTGRFELFGDRPIGKDKPYFVYSVKPYLDKEEVKSSTYIPKEKYDKYLQLPKGLPSRLKELSLSITEGYSNDFDKVKAIEAYLRENYKYTLSPKPTPNHADFVDNFLFESEEGYCTYFATSLAIMSRISGIPTRYVEGFKTPNSKTDGEYHVYDENAHAWVEAYIEGQGWFIFEPTPAYETVVYMERAQEEVTDSAPTVSQRQNTNQDQGEIERNFDSDIEMEDFLGSPLGDLDSYEGKTMLTAKQAISTLVGLILIAMLVIITILMNRYRKYKLKLIKGDTNKLVRENYRYILSLFYLNNTGKFKDETPIEYCRRIEGVCSWEEDIELSDVTSILNEAVYSKETLSEEKLEKITKYRINLSKYIMKKNGPVKYFSNILSFDKTYKDV